ncbi:Flp pilus assembly protein CpaB [Palleronia sediminis]|uniref:Flp pilus assembly protein CpaB n=1 Tax=Palleronia sediminis TaxID=2547833 RepID=A0A4R6A690_9RHOB|nr:Flp pilus assembly protein CpaB [Palleronia sediminis]TDL76313.1 Flp pilus assembly protein CpaB [Palleronia sediminis]
MRIVFIGVLAIGLALAGFAVYMIQNQIAEYQTALEAERAKNGASVPMRPVIVVNRDIPYGQPLVPEDLRVVSFPLDAVPEGLFGTFEEMFPRGADMPRTTLRSMLANEAVLASKVSEPGEGAGVSSRISKGKRAFAISVDVATGVSGFLRPNDRVDVYWTGMTPDTRSEVTRLIDRSVRIVAVDQSADEERTGATVARTVTVEATPQQVAKLAQAQSSGRLSLSLVGGADDVEVGVVEMDQRSLLGIRDDPVPVVEKDEVCTIRTRRGNEVVEIPIPCTN